MALASTALPQSAIDPLTVPREVLDSLYDGVYLADKRRRITYWNRAAERITGFRADEVVGKRCSDHILVHVNAAGQALCGVGCPLAGALDDGSPQELDVYVRHRSGHRVPVTVRVVPLRDATGGVVGAAEIFADRTEQLEATSRIADLEAMAFLDPLTRVANRRFLNRHLDARLHELDRFEWPFGVLMLDIDHFKRINDSLGHATGDHVLAMVARTATGNARSFDLVARYGGDEFVHVVSNVDLVALREVGWRLGNLVRNSALITDDQTVGVTVSVGAATARRTDTIESLLERADAEVYRAKRAGRDRISCEGDP